MSKPRIPNRKELAQWITQQSELKFPYHTEYAIGFNHYRDSHPAIWCGVRRALAYHGYSSDNDGWRQLVKDFCGLRTPTRAENNALNKGRKLGKRRPSDRDMAKEYVEPPPNAVQTWNTYGYGLKCKLDRTEPVRMYCPYRHRSVLVPAERVAMVV